MSLPQSKINDLQVEITIKEHFLNQNIYMVYACDLL